jgi:hypothetical protein
MKWRRVACAIAAMCIAGTGCLLAAPRAGAVVRLLSHSEMNALNASAEGQAADSDCWTVNPPPEPGQPGNCRTFVPCTTDQDCEEPASEAQTVCNDDRTKKDCFYDGWRDIFDCRWWDQQCSPRRNVAPDCNEESNRCNMLTGNVAPCERWVRNCKW